MLSGCGEEIFNKSTLKDSDKANTLKYFTEDECAGFTFDKPEVDFLFVIDNSGSASSQQFQSIKTQLSNVFSYAPNDFNYHMLFAPLLPTSGESITALPVIISDPTSVPSITNINRKQSINEVTVFAPPAGGNVEAGFSRVQSIIDGNRSNGIFRNNSHVIVILISNEYDTSLFTYVGGNQIYQQAVYNSHFETFKKYTRKYVQGGGSVSNPLNAESFRFIAVTPHSNCGSFTYRPGYKEMAIDLYNYNNIPSVPGFSYPQKDAHNICSGNYQQIFSSIDATIQKVVVEHSYDHWKISNANANQIQADDITVTKILADGTRINVPESATQGFEYLGYKVNQNTRYEPTIGEPRTGLMIRLNGNARVHYQECISAKTRTPTEWFGYKAVQREPDLSTVKVVIRGQEYPQSSSDGWTYIGYKEIQNIKVPGPTNAAILPAVNKSGYFFQLHGEAIYTNGESITIYYKPKAI
jgi:hypothetical protein